MKSNIPNSSTNSDQNKDEYSQKDIDSLRKSLGRSTWTFLHSMAANYPNNPSKEQEIKVKNLIEALADFYPCSPCAKDFRESIKEHPPRTKNREDLSQWFCEQHNIVNEKVGKPKFDCKYVLQRWRGEKINWIASTPATSSSNDKIGLKNNVSNVENPLECKFCDDLLGNASNDLKKVFKDLGMKDKNRN